jgi:hypothetical protein
MKKIQAAVVAVAVVASTLAFGVVAASPASAENCRPSMYGKDIFGNQKYNCSDGSYTLKKPMFSDRWDDPLSTYELKKDYGFGTKSQKCRYSSLSKGYNCR